MPPVKKQDQDSNRFLLLIMILLLLIFLFRKEPLTQRPYSLSRCSGGGLGWGFFAPTPKKPPPYPPPEYRERENRTALAIFHPLRVRRSIVRN